MNAPRLEVDDVDRYVRVKNGTEDQRVSVRGPVHIQLTLIAWQYALRCTACARDDVNVPRPLRNNGIERNLFPIGRPARHDNFHRRKGQLKPLSPTPPAPP